MLYGSYAKIHKRNAFFMDKKLVMKAEADLYGQKLLDYPGRI